MKENFKELSAKISEIFWNCFYGAEEEKTRFDGEAFDKERDELIIKCGWTVEEYLAAELAAEEAFYESLNWCSDCGKKLHLDYYCDGTPHPPSTIIHCDDSEEPEDLEE